MSDKDKKSVTLTNELDAFVDSLKKFKKKRPVDPSCEGKMTEKHEQNSQKTALKVSDALLAHLHPIELRVISMLFGLDGTGAIAKHEIAQTVSEQTRPEDLYNYLNSLPGQDSPRSLAHLTVDDITRIETIGLRSLLRVRKPKYQ